MCDDCCADDVVTLVNECLSQEFFYVLNILLIDNFC